MEKNTAGNWKKVKHGTAYSDPHYGESFLSLIIVDILID